MYSIQHHVIILVNDLRQVGGFSRVLWFPPPISEILLKVALNTIALAKQILFLLALTALILSVYVFQYVLLSLPHVLYNLGKKIKK